MKKVKGAKDAKQGTSELKSLVRKDENVKRDPTVPVFEGRPIICERHKTRPSGETTNSGGRKYH